jgi:hypothetical protein
MPPPYKQLPRPFLNKEWKSQNLHLILVLQTRLFETSIRLSMDDTVRKLLVQ